MKGMNRETGKWISGRAHLRQSIRDILTTTRGERLIRRDYGSNVFAYIDQPLTDALTLEIMAEVANAVHDFEPRIGLTKVAVAAADPGHLTLKLEGAGAPASAGESFVIEASGAEA